MFNWLTPSRPVRIAHRGGGLKINDWILHINLTNCIEFCQRIMQSGTLCGEQGRAPSGYACHPYYAKCFDTITSQPLNGRRIAWPSQDGTTDLDPGLPQITPITNWTACVRMSVFTKIIPL